jgi:NTP pyrophosphatase (non-canonical NTP hydrolase)
MSEELKQFEDVITGTMTFQQLQERVCEWSVRNFKDQPSYRPLLGAFEELGELSHAHLKGEQGIRHTPDQIRDMKIDAVADVIIYLADYCAREGIFMQIAVEKTWTKVAQRAWEKNRMGAAEGENK